MSRWGYGMASRMRDAACYEAHAPFSSGMFRGRDFAAGETSDQWGRALELAREEHRRARATVAEDWDRAIKHVYADGLGRRNPDRADATPP